jgi:hypothetical protein
MVLRPFQAPHPPLWYGLGHMAGAEWAAANKVHVLAPGPCDATLPFFQRHCDVCLQGAPMPGSIGRHVWRCR